MTTPSSTSFLRSRSIANSYEDFIGLSAMSTDCTRLGYNRNPLCRSLRAARPPTAVFAAWGLSAGMRLARAPLRLRDSEMRRDDERHHDRSGSPGAGCGFELRTEEGAEDEHRGGRRGCQPQGVL